MKIRKTLEENKRHTIEFDQDDPNKIPQHTWGRGNEVGNGKGYTYKDFDGLYFTYTIRETAPSGLPAGTEIGIRLVDEGVQYFDVTDGQWKLIGTVGGTMVDSGIIECVHVSSVGRDVTLRIKNVAITELPSRGTYQFNVVYNIPTNPTVRILKSNGEEIISHDWKWQNGNNIITKDFMIGARVQILDSGASFFSAGAALQKGLSNVWFQKAVGEKTILRFAMIGNVIGIRGDI